MVYWKICLFLVCNWPVKWETIAHPVVVFLGIMNMMDSCYSTLWPLFIKGVEDLRLIAAAQEDFGFSNW